MSLMEELSCNGVEPSGPVSAWPEERNLELIKSQTARTNSVGHATHVKASLGTMAKGLAKTAAQAVAYGKVSQEVRDERYATCKSCPFFIEDSKRCSECGCFMEAKTWVGGDPDLLCPKKKWSR